VQEFGEELGLRAEERKPKVESRSRLNGREFEVAS
jgi:hypothetical protein